MILFREEHVAPILSGVKVQTRRLGARRWRVGGVHACYTRPPFAKGGAEPFCRVLITDVRQERLFDVTFNDALAEGYERLEQQAEEFTQIIEQQKRMLDMAWQQFDATRAHDYEDKEDWLAELIRLPDRSGQQADDAAADAWFRGEPR